MELAQQNVIPLLGGGTIQLGRPLECPQEMMNIFQIHFSRQMRKATKHSFDSFNLFVMRDIQGFCTIGANNSLTSNAEIMLHLQESPHWCAGFRFHRTQPWWLCLSAYKKPPCILGVKPHVPLGVYEIKFCDAPTIGTFFAYYTYALHRIEKECANLDIILPEYRSIRLEHILTFLNSYIDSDKIGELSTILHGTNFFPVERKGTEEGMGYYTHLSNSVTDWTVAEDILTSYPGFIDNEGMANGNCTAWEGIKSRKDTTFMVARSKGQDNLESRDQILGFLVAFTDKHTQNNHTIFALCVLPDDRRQGIATSLLSAYFSHTRVQKVRVLAFFPSSRDPLRAAAFCKKHGGTLQTRAENCWVFDVPNILTPHIIQNSK